MKKLKLSSLYGYMYKKGGIKMRKGIDISTWQQNVDYSKLKEQGIEFAIIRSRIW